MYIIFYIDCFTSPLVIAIKPKFKYKCIMFIIFHTLHKLYQLTCIYISKVYYDLNVRILRYYSLWHLFHSRSSFGRHVTLFTLSMLPLFISDSWLVLLMVNIWKFRCECLTIRLKFTYFPKRWSSEKRYTNIFKNILVNNICITLADLGKTLMCVYLRKNFLASCDHPAA